jgi:hypothetical protein
MDKLRGVGTPNGISYHLPTNSLHVTWTNRHFIEYEGAKDGASTAHKAQAGPNGPENNEGLLGTRVRSLDVLAEQSLTPDLVRSM